MFIELTHYFSGERTFVLANSIQIVREKEKGKTLIVPKSGDGMYVEEDPIYIIDTIKMMVEDGNYMEQGEEDYVQLEKEV